VGPAYQQMIMEQKKKGMNEMALLKGLLPQERRKRGWSHES
jgi:hypothetical protein